MSHLIDSTLIYIHPPLAVLGYILIVLSLVSLLAEQRHSLPMRRTRICLYGAWLCTLLGLVSGMLWAQMAWGSYWSWDPKESLTLLLFLGIGSSVLVYKRYKKAAVILLVLSLLCIAINIGITVGNFGLHSSNL